jgi:RNA polymerase sigma factor (TIGR02999 family)
VNTASTKDVTELLLQWNSGDRAALDRLMPAIYSELRRLARQKMRYEDPAHTLQPTALVSEMYLRLVDQKRVNWQNRAHFFGAAAQIIRRVLVDHGRARHRLKRNAIKISLNNKIAATAPPFLDVVILDDALDRLAKLDPEQEKVVELRFFAGLSIEETAEALAISPATVKRYWTTARAWLYREMTKEIIKSNR